MFNNEYPYSFDGITGHSRRPYYNDESDYNTNSPSYYDDLARKERLIRYLAEKIGMYDKELEKRFKEWDKNIEELPEDLKRMFLAWVDDGTLAKILAQLLLDDYVTNDELDKVKEELKGFVTKEEMGKLEQGIKDSVPYLMDKDIVYTVGKLGDFDTLNNAIISLSKRFLPYKQGGIKAEIILLEDYIMKEQVIVKGLDLGWITISSRKNEPTMIDRDSMTINTIESRYPAFTGLDKAVLPTINVLFEFTLGDKVSGFDGITVARGSKVQLTPGSGVNKADRGLGAYYNSLAFCYMEGLTEGGNGIGAGVTTGVQFKNCTNRAFMATYGSTIHTARSQLQNCQGDHAVYAIWGSNVDVYQSDMSGCAGTGIMSRDGSRVNARETNVSRCNIGYHASHGGEINARSLKESIWIGNSAQFCKEYGALASYASRIELDNADVSNSERHGVHASDGSIINAGGVYANNVADMAISAFRASTINFDKGQAKMSGKVAVLADSNSNINANGVNASESKDHAILARNGSTISANGADVHHSVKGFFAYNGSIISAKLSIAERCNEGYIARFGSKIDAEGADASNCLLTGFGALEGSTLNANNSKAHNISSVTTGVLSDQSTAYKAVRASTLNCRGSKALSCNIASLSYEGSLLNASSTDFTKAIKKAYQVYRGSTLTVVAGTGSLSQDENVATQHGIIYAYTPD